MPCSNCMVEYTKFRKEHGCSKCAFSFCQKCISKKAVIPGLSSQPVSVCDSCYAQLTGQAFTPGPNLNKPTDRFERKPGGPKPKNWWGDDDLPPPSMRRDYMKPQPRIIPKNNGGSGGSKVEADMNEIHNRFAKLQNKPVDEVKDPRILITGKDENGQAPTGAKVLDAFKEDEPTTSNGKSATKADNQTKSITVEEIEERLAALRGVPVDVIRKPRLMVVDDDEEDEFELPDEALKLLKEAENRSAAVKRKAPSAYENHGLQVGDENVIAENRESTTSLDSTTFKKILKECEDTPSVASSVSSFNPFPNFAEQCRQMKQEALEAERQATLFIQQSEQIPPPKIINPSEGAKQGPSEPKTPETPKAFQQKKHGGFFSKLFKSHSKDNI